MDRIKTVVGDNLKMIRKDKQLTLQELSDITGVSKSMLGEIERSVTNPTITVLWKIADGLKIPFTMLINEEKEPISVIKHNETKQVTTNGEFDIHTIFEFDSKKKFEIYNMTFQPHLSGDIKKHSKGVEEYILVYEGRLIVEVKNESFNLEKGDSIRFLADVDHRYINESSVIAKAHSIIFYN